MNKKQKTPVLTKLPPPPEPGLTMDDRANADLRSHTDRDARDAADALVNGLSEEQGRAIWQKYGISPRNYTYMQQKKMMLKEVSSRIMASATEEAIAMQTEADLALSNEIVSQATTGEEHTEKELLQQILVLLRENRIGLSELESALNQASAQTAWQQAIEDEKEIQDMEAKARLKMESVTREQQDSMF